VLSLPGYSFRTSFSFVPLIDEPPADEAASLEIDPEQADQIEFEEAVRIRKEVAEKDCAEVEPDEKSEPTAEERARKQQIRI
jgi:hypothetical protein